MHYYIKSADTKTKTNIMSDANTNTGNILVFFSGLRNKSMCVDDEIDVKVYVIAI